MSETNRPAAEYVFDLADALRKRSLADAEGHARSLIEVTLTKVRDRRRQIRIQSGHPLATQSGERLTTQSAAPHRQPRTGFSERGVQWLSESRLAFFLLPRGKQEDLRDEIADVHREVRRDFGRGMSMHDARRARRQKYRALMFGFALKTLWDLLRSSLPFLGLARSNGGGPTTP